jgi:hypothetical protein
MSEGAFLLLVRRFDLRGNGGKDDVMRAFLRIALGLGAVAGGVRGGAQPDFRGLPTFVSRADLDYNEPARRSEEGMPVGNGRMGSLVWTTPAQLKFQINRVDVFAADGRTVSFPEADSDFASGCGYVDVSLVSG